MSTKRTANYKLHQWEPADDFLRSEFNENFTKLDEVVHSGLAAGEAALQGLIVTGSYIGDGADTRKISLGFTPRMVFVITSAGQIQGGGYTYGGLALKEQAASAVEVVEGGFSVRRGGTNPVMYSNTSNYKYFYWALR